MKFSIFMPSEADIVGKKLPVIYFLGGLCNTEESMIAKIGIQRYAEQYNIIVVGADTSPRGCNLPGENDDWDLGTGASFYVDATQAPWNKHYRMYSYITRELRDVVEKNFRVVDGTRVGITGHSMGGHGALVCFLRNPGIYKAASAFAPVSCPIKSAAFENPVRKCMNAYLGADKTTWLDYDASELVKRQAQRNVPILIDQGDQDEWLSQMLPDVFVETCEQAGQPLKYNLRKGYDHGCYFVSTFIGDHMQHFAGILHR